MCIDVFDPFPMHCTQVMRCIRRVRGPNSSGPRGGTVGVVCAPVRRGTWSGFTLVLLWCLATLVAASDVTGNHVPAPAYPPSGGSCVQVTPARAATRTESAAPLLSPVRLTIAPATPPEQTRRLHTAVTFTDPSGEYLCTKLLGSDAYQYGECVCTGDAVDPTCAGVLAKEWPWLSMCDSLQLNRRHPVYFGETLLGPVFPEHATSVSGCSMGSPLAEPRSDDPDYDSWYDDAEASFRLVLHKSSPNWIPLTLMPVGEGDAGTQLAEQLDFERHEYHQDEPDPQDPQHRQQHEGTHAHLEQSSRLQQAVYQDQLDEQQRQEVAYAQEQRRRHQPSTLEITLRGQEETVMLQREYEQNLCDLENHQYELNHCAGLGDCESPQQASRHEDCAAQQRLDDDGSCSPVFDCPGTATACDKNLDTLDGFMRAADCSADLDDFRRSTPPEDTPDVPDPVDLEEPDLPSYEHTGTDLYESTLHRQVYAYLFWNQYPLKLQGKGTKLSRKRKTFAQNARRRYKLQLCPRTKEMELFHIRDGNMTTKRREGRNITSVAQAKWHNLRMVPRHADSLRLVKSFHEATHQGHNILQARLSEKFFIPNLSQKCMDVSGANCSVCSTHAAVPKKPANAILTSRRGELVIFDLTKFYVPVRPRVPHARRVCVLAHALVRAIVQVPVACEPVTMHDRTARVLCGFS